MYVVFILPEQSHERIRNAGQAFAHLAAYCSSQQTLASMPVYPSYEDAELAGLYYKGELRVPNTICICKINGSLIDIESCEVEKMTLIGQESSTRSVMPFRLDKNVSLSLFLIDDPNFDEYWSKPTPSITSISSRERLKKMLSTPQASSGSDSNGLAPKRQAMFLGRGNTKNEDLPNSSGKKEDEQPSTLNTRKLKA